MRPSPKKTNPRRLAFTLVELMIAMTIIAILIGLLIPAIMSAKRNASIAEVQTDIKGIEGALAAFNAKYGEYPPSRITLYQNAAGWTTNSAEARRSRGIIRKYWPQFDFSNPIYPNNFFVSGNSVTLNGSECLVFFLGGVKDSYPNGGLIGFSNNPARPFALGSSRVKPFLEFENGRLVDTNGNGMPEYLDPISSQTAPYIYYSAYSGRGYDSSDVLTGMPACYTQNTTSRPPAYKPQSCQLISAGFDYTYGTGGPYLPNDANPLPGAAARQFESDNITNFSGGTLE